MSAPSPALLWTSDAVAEIRRLRQAEGRPDADLRVDVRLGGCQGFKVYFELDAAQADDVVVAAAEDVRLLIQEDGLPMIRGGILDYEDSHRGSGFRLANPHAQKECGCGQAFYADFESEQEQRAHTALATAEP